MSLPYITIVLDKPRKLRFDITALLDFEQLTGKIALSSIGDRSMQTTMQFLWAALKQEEPELTYEKTVELVKQYAKSPLTVAKKVAEALGESLKDEEESPNGETPAAKK
jgi:hypothetical protein